MTRELLKRNDRGRAMALVNDIIGVTQFTSHPSVDDRGEWHRVWDISTIESGSVPNSLVSQVSISTNRVAGTLRGIHYLQVEAAERKTVQCFEGSAFDVIVDMRPNSPTFLDHMSVTLDSKVGNRISIPPGCGHGFQTLEACTSLAYTMTAPYDPKLEMGIRFDDPVIGIAWPMIPSKVSEKDLNWNLLEVMNNK